MTTANRPDFTKTAKARLRDDGINPEGWLAEIIRGEVIRHYARQPGMILSAIGPDEVKKFIEPILKAVTEVHAPPASEPPKKKPSTTTVVF